ncbi:Uncharacterised protein [Salmonella enterica subsp. enterica]|uniref:Uncharacterized protein n=1 Tax=Salmonella enterica I TaxID=59201 RepID=A0A447MV77_SALET|nr:Uncharacterised protein [Salmonella enterica subsp. enterica]
MRCSRSFFPIVIKQTADRRGIFFPRFVAIHQDMPLDSHTAGELHQRFQARLSKLNDFNALRIKMMSTLTRQLINNPGFRLAFHQ